MSTFQGFTEAARLYAANYRVVEAMEKAFRESVDAFLNSLRDEIGQQVRPATLQEKQTEGYRYWWLAQDNADKDAHPQLWLKADEARIVSPGELISWAVAPRASDSQLPEFTKLATTWNFCRPASGGRWSLFTVVLQYPQEDPVGHTASAIASVLKGLQAIEETP